MPNQKPNEDDNASGGQDQGHSLKDSVEREQPSLPSEEEEEEERTPTKGTGSAG